MNTILVVDTDVSFRDRLYKKLEEEGITDKYELRTIVPDTTLPSVELVQSCLGQIREMLLNELNVTGVLVDIVIIEGSSRRLDTTGIKIAAEIAKLYPNVPVFNITGKHSDEDSDTDIISEATLENTDGVLMKNYLVGKYFSAGRLKLMFEKARLRRIKTDGIAAPAEIPNAVRKSFNLDTVDARVLAAINDLGGVEFSSLLKKLFPNAEGTLSYVRPGRSGAIVFRVTAKIHDTDKTATRPKSWILKLSSTISELEREITNYHAMSETPLPRVFYPKLLPKGLVSVGSLAGFALELEEDAMPLLDVILTLNTDGVAAVIGGIERFISDTYGDSRKRIAHVWSTYYGLHENAWASILSTLQQRERLFKTVVPADFERVIRFVKTKGSSEDAILAYEDEIDQRVVHGDFNGRNLLLTKSNQLVVIDFSARAMSHVAKDVAKLERDVVFRSGSESAKYYDWASIDNWKEVFPMITRGQVFSTPKSSANSAISKSLDLIFLLRKTLLHHSPDLKESEYLLALLHYSLLAIAHPEISIQKKAFAIQYVSYLLASLN